MVAITDVPLGMGIGWWALGLFVFLVVAGLLWVAIQRYVLPMLVRREAATA